MNFVLTTLLLLALVIACAVSMLWLSERPTLQARPLLLGSVVTLEWFTAFSLWTLVFWTQIPDETPGVYVLEGLFLATALIFGGIAGSAISAAHRPPR